MRTISIIIFLCILSSIDAKGQYFLESKCDNMWVMGEKSPQCTTCGGIGFNFNSLPFSTFTFDIPNDIMLRGSSGAINDPEGELLFYTNGRVVVDRAGNIMPNGEELSYGDVYQQYNWYYPVYQGNIILPIPESNSRYVIIHQKGEWITNMGLIMTDLLCSTVDMNLNNGYGDVTEKNTVLIHDTLAAGYVTAVRHGNGRDWWLLAFEFNRPYYYPILVSPGGISVQPRQNLQVPVGHNVAGLASFSPDGRYFALVNDWDDTPNRIDLYKFDRCSGRLSGYWNLGFSLPNADIGWGCCFSQNSRFLYFNSCLFIYQFDVWADDIAGSKQLIGTYDGTLWNQSLITFDQMVLAPDSTIMISASSTPYVHVIEHPDSLGTACSFVQRKIVLPRRVWNFPNYPHFRLGRAEGQLCDTLYHTGVNDILFNKPGKIEVYPNPCHDLITLDVGEYAALSGLYLEITNMLSEKVYREELSPGQKTVKCSVAQLPPGIYSCCLRSANRLHGSARFIISR